MVLASFPRASVARLALVVVPATLAAAPALAADPFALIVVPDTQNYADFDDINVTYNLGQMRWIRDNMSNLNIKFVMHLGDHQNPANPYRARTDNIYEPDFSKPLGNVAETNAAWDRANDAIQVLDNNNIPYSSVAGNHDYQTASIRAEPWKYLKLFGPQRYINEQATWNPADRTYGGASPAHPVNQYAGMNTYHRFDGGGYKFLNLALQYEPDEHDLRWAQQIINENPGLPTIVTTHMHILPGGGYQYPRIFDKLIENNPQVIMSFNGHRTGTRRTVDQNIANLDVQQMLVDYQAVQLDSQLGGNYYRGGGVLHIVEFNPDNDRVTVKGYSPVADRYLPNNFDAFGNDPPGPEGPEEYNFRASNFGFDLDMESRFGLPNKAGIVRTQTLRDGVNGYNATTDTWIDASAPTTTHGGDTEAWVDGNRSGGNPSQALIRFDLFGAGAIPRGSMIESATLVLHTSQKINDTDNPQSPDGMAIYRLLETFGNNTTWNTDGGYSIDGLEAILAASGTVIPSTAGGFVSFDVTESMYAWSMGATNHGWVLDALGNNGWRFDTSEHANVNFRPQLNVTYRMVPEPAAAGTLMLLAFTALGSRRRRCD